MPEDLAALLTRLGIGPDEIAEAAAAGPLDLELLVADRVALPDRRYLTPPEVWERAEVDEQTARRLWRAMGFPDPPDDEPVFCDADVAALRTAAALFERAGIERGVALQQARTMGQAMARIAGAQQDVIEERTASDDVEESLVGAAELAERALPAVDKLIVYLYRRHLAAATRRNVLLRSQAAGAGIRLCVGFADLVGFTALSQELSDEELAAVVDEFGSAAADAVVAHGGHVVKMIGDEVMFSTDRPEEAVALALDLVASYPGEENGLTIRAGIAAGEVLSRDGDLYGP
ncbi:MAG: adenylate/guanylate cyclase domain-containing protein, partial [Gemmatimonadales bacterium]